MAFGVSGLEMRAVGAMRAVVNIFRLLHGERCGKGDGNYGFGADGSQHSLMMHEGPVLGDRTVACIAHLTKFDHRWSSWRGRGMMSVIV